MVLRRVGRFAISGAVGKRRSPFVGKQILSKAIESKFRQGYWEANYSTVIEQGRKNDFNAGQQAIFDEYQAIAEEFCNVNGDGFNPKEYNDYMLFELGDAKYNAISETIEQTANELYDLWDHATSHDGVGMKKYMGVIYD